MGPIVLCFLLAPALVAGWSIDADQSDALQADTDAITGTVKAEQLGSVGCIRGCDSCNTGCDEGCDLSCNSGCRTGCDSSCDSSCNSSCDRWRRWSCDSSCDMYCNSSCDDWCNQGCDASCNHGCDGGCTSCDEGCVGDVVDGAVRGANQAAQNTAEAVTYAANQVARAGGNAARFAVSTAQDIDVTAMANELASHAQEYAELIATNFRGLPCSISGDEFRAALTDLNHINFDQLSDMASEASSIAEGTHLAAVGACQTVWTALNALGPVNVFINVLTYAPAM